MPKCKGVKRNGEPCNSLILIKGTEYCGSHQDQAALASALVGAEARLNPKMELLLTQIDEVLSEHKTQITQEVRQELQRALKKSATTEFLKGVITGVVANYVYAQLTNKPQAETTETANIHSWREHYRLVHDYESLKELMRFLWVGMTCGEVRALLGDPSDGLETIEYSKWSGHTDIYPCARHVLNHGGLWAWYLSIHYDSSFTRTDSFNDIPRSNPPDEEEQHRLVVTSISCGELIGYEGPN